MPMQSVHVLNMHNAKSMKLSQMMSTNLIIPINYIQSVTTMMAPTYHTPTSTPQTHQVSVPDSLTLQPTMQAPPT